MAVAFAYLTRCPIDLLLLILIGRDCSQRAAPSQVPSRQSATNCLQESISLRTHYKNSCCGSSEHALLTNRILIIIIHQTTMKCFRFNGMIFVVVRQHHFWMYESDISTDSDLMNERPRKSNCFLSIEDASEIKTNRNMLHRKHIF
jgi:hypothetical protein